MISAVKVRWDCVFVYQVSERPQLAVASPRVVGNEQIRQDWQRVQDLGLDVHQLVAAEIQTMELGKIVKRLGIDLRYQTPVELNSLQKRHVAEQSVLQSLHRIVIQVDFPQPKRVAERSRMQRVNIVVREVQLDEYLQASERVFVHQFDRTRAHDQFVYVYQAHRLERVLVQLQYVIVGQVEHLHVAAQVFGYSGETGIRALCLFLSADPFAPALLRVAYRGPIGLGRGPSDWRTQ